MTTTRTDHLGDEQQQPITRSRKNILRPLLIALAAWRLLAVFLSVLEYLSHGELLQQEVVRRRMSVLFIPSLLFLAGPLLLFLVTFGLVRGQWNKVTALGMKTGCGAFALVAIVWAGIAGWAFVNDEDPWEALPWVTPILPGGISSAQPWSRSVRLRWTETRSGARRQGSERACQQRSASQRNFALRSL